MLRAISQTHFLLRQPRAVSSHNPTRHIRQNTSTSIPNARPDHVSLRLHRLISSNRIMQCIFYGVQDVTKNSPAKVAIRTATGVMAQTVKKADATPAVEIKPARSIPNPRPSTIWPGLASFFDRFPILQCVFYGVQEITTPEQDSKISNVQSTTHPPRSMPQATNRSVAGLRPVRQSRNTFKDLDIAMAAMSLGGAK